MLDNFIDQKLKLLLYGFGALVAYAALKILPEFLKKLSPLDVVTIAILFVLRKLSQKCTYRSIQAFKMPNSDWIFLCDKFKFSIRKWQLFHRSINGNGWQI